MMRRRPSCTDVTCTHLFSNGLKERTLVGFLKPDAEAGYAAFLKQAAAVAETAASS